MFNYLNICKVIMVELLIHLQKAKLFIYKLTTTMNFPIVIVIVSNNNYKNEFVFSTVSFLTLTTTFILLYP